MGLTPILLPLRLPVPKKDSAKIMPHQQPFTSYLVKELDLVFLTNLV